MLRKRIRLVAVLLAAGAMTLIGSTQAQASPTTAQDLAMYNQVKFNYSFPVGGHMFIHIPKNGYSFDGSTHHWGQTYWNRPDGFIYILAFTDTGATGCAVGTWCIWFRGQGPGPTGPYCPYDGCYNPPYGVAGWEKRLADTHEFRLLR